MLSWLYFLSLGSIVPCYHGCIFLVSGLLYYVIMVVSL